MIPFMIREGWRLFWRHKVASIACISTIAFSTLLISTLGQIFYVLYGEFGNIQNEIKIEFFLENKIPSTERGQLQNEIAKNKGIKQIEHINKQQAESIFKKEFGTMGSDFIELDFLPESFVISIDRSMTASSIERFIDKYDSHPRITDIRYDKPLLMLVRQRTFSYSIIALVILLAVLCIASLLTYNTIRLSIDGRRNLITIMQLVGATTTFIRRPFTVEGMLHGIVAGILALTLHYILFNIMIPTLLTSIGTLAWPFGQWYYLATIIIGISTVMGFLGGKIASFKYIHI